MKEFIKKYIILFIIIILLLIIVSVFLIIFLNRKNSSTPDNSYNFNEEVVELPNSKTYKNDKLLSSHCLDGICIENATFYYNDDMGRVEYTITNNSKKVKSGYLKMVFNDKSLLVVYNNLNPKETIKSRSQYQGIEIKDKSNYKLKKVTKEEISKILK